MRLLWPRGGVLLLLCVRRPSGRWSGLLCLLRSVRSGFFGRFLSICRLFLSAFGVFLSA